MRIDRHLIALFAASIMMSDCNPPNAPTQPSVPTLPKANVTCNELSFYLDSTLGDGYECESVPENSSSDIPTDIFIYPAHTELTIQNYPVTNSQFPPGVWIYPVSRFNELLPDVLPKLVIDLERLITGGTRNSDEMPFLPPIPQTQSFFSHETGISFNGGQGVRFITDYSDGPFPISNMNIIYTFQGLTDDGKYWVAVTLPISSPILPASDDTLSEGYTQESLTLNYDSYVDNVKVALESHTPGSFSPTLQSLDNLVRGITIR